MRVQSGTPGKWTSRPRERCWRVSWIPSLLSQFGRSLVEVSGVSSNTSTNSGRASIWLMKEDQHDRNALQLLQRTKVNEVAHRRNKDFDKTFGLEKEGLIQRNRDTRCHIQELREFLPRGITKVRRQRHTATSATRASENSGVRNSKVMERPKVSHLASALNCPSASPSAMKV